ncbi:MAG TPA: head GIN domain-containing protein [Flavobacterium sp.]|uniref:head GIN domain-containing protein n=1 Tax=Flavobacterium sp. TaxID=239 RepID=UPI002B4B0557|nr:head GIN domain-containing protein [Flavobacterium sp.]HLO73584.1 head GIN domain-containing protein [Flavobacterium sp.]
MKTTFKILALLIVLTLTSCNANLNLGNGVDGSGNIITEKRTINENFDKISSSTGVTVIVEQGTPTDIEVETDDNLMQYVITKVENGTLIVKIEGNINTMSSIDVRVKMNSIVGLEASSGSSITSKNTLKGNTIAVKSSSGSEIEAVLEYENVSCESSSGSNITVSGKTLKLETASSSGSEIDANQLAANDVFAQSSSGSSTSVKPIVKLDAKASSGSSIDYVQTPKTITKEETSGGSVEGN